MIIGIAGTGGGDRLWQGVVLAVGQGQLDEIQALVREREVAHLHLLVLFTQIADRIAAGHPQAAGTALAAAEQGQGTQAQQE
ncbi:hypothetical protein D3C85_1382940 [compost metagenome]